MTELKIYAPEDDGMTEKAASAARLPQNLRIEALRYLQTHDALPAGAEHTTSPQTTEAEKIAQFHQTILARREMQGLLPDGTNPNAKPKPGPTFKMWTRGLDD